MVTILRVTARGALFASLLAVLFAAGIPAADSSLIRLEDGVNELIYDASRSVVTVEAVRMRAPGSPGHEAVQTLIASGLIFDTLGHIIVSASSVVGYDRILIRYDNYILPARLIGVDYFSGLALVTVGRRVGVPVHIGPAKGCAGQMVIALGNAYGVRASPSIGFCAGMRPDGTMQFSAAITSGTVGGGVFDMSGTLMGAISGGIGRDRWAEVGLAVPAAELGGIVNYLVRHGDRVAGWIGVSVADIEITPGVRINYPAALATDGRRRGRVIDRGVMVTRIIPGSPAAQIGLRTGDLLFTIGDHDIASAHELQERVSRSRPGALLTVGFVRNNMPNAVQLRVGRQVQPVLDGAVQYDERRR